MSVLSVMHVAFKKQLFPLTIHMKVLLLPKLVFFNNFCSLLCTLLMCSLKSSLEPLGGIVCQQIKVQ